MISPTKKWDLKLINNYESIKEESNNQEVQKVDPNNITNELMDLSKCCRLCLNPNQDISMDNYFYEGSVKYFDVAMCLTNIQLNSMDIFPTKICMECASKLVLFYKFRKKCHLTNEKLHSAYESSQQKQEILIDEDNAKDIEETQKESPQELSNEQKKTTKRFENNEKIEVLYQLIDDDEDKGEEQENHLNISDIEVLEEQVENLVEEFDYLVEEVDNLIEYDEESIRNDEITMITNDENTPNTDIEYLENEKLIENVIPGRQCEYCGQIFNRKSTLDQHRNTHTGIKKFSCLECNSLFSRKSHLIIHLRIHQNVKPYKCEICDKGFIKNSDLLRHCRIHSDARNYGCKMCDKRFKRSADVISHMRVHTGDKPYRCNQCPKQYTSHSSLKKHLIKMNHQNEVRVLLQYDDNPDNSDCL